MNTTGTQMVTVLPAPDEAQARALATDIQAQLARLPTAIMDPETCRAAKEYLPALKRAEDKVVTFFRDIKDAAFKAHRAITAKEAEQLTPIRAARQRLSTLIYDFEREQERQRREAEQKAAQEERQRQEDEALRIAAEMATEAPELADQVLEQAIAAPAPIVALPSQRADVSGVSSRANWTFRYAGCPSGVEWDTLSAEDQERVMRLLPREYLRPDESKLRKVVKAMKGGTRIPGVEVYDHGTLAVRG